MLFHFTTSSVFQIAYFAVSKIPSEYYFKVKETSRNDDALHRVWFNKSPISLKIQYVALLIWSYLMMQKTLVPLV